MRLPDVRLRHLLLFAAALLHLAGAAALPVLHAVADARAAATVVLRAPGDDEAPPRAPHDDLGCALCQAIGAAALPAEGAAVVVPSRDGDAVHASESSTVGATSDGSSLARAPPAHS